MPRLLFVSAVCGPQRKCFLVRFDRGLELLVPVECGAETVVGIGIVFPELNSLLKLSHRFLELSAVVESCAEVVMRFGKIGLSACRTRQNVRSLLILS